ncbi:hypothetical protein WMO21_18390, partial [Lachnospiraceae bacterium CLA-AA-H58]
KQGRQHKLISTIFLATSVTKKLDHNNLRKDVSVMCNLSQGIVDDTKVEIIINMYENKFSLEQISLATKKSIAEIEKIIKENKSVLV